MYQQFCRCDQYRWVHLGVYNVKCEGIVLKKRSNAIEDELCDRRKGNRNFQRWDYWGYKDLYLVHYTGDHTVFHPFKHRSAQKSKRPFIRSAPHVKEKVCIYICCICMMSKPLFIVLQVLASNPLNALKAIHTEIINEDEVGQDMQFLHHVM